MLLSYCFHSSNKSEVFSYPGLTKVGGKKVNVEQIFQEIMDKNILVEVKNTAIVLSVQKNAFFNSVCLASHI